MMKTFTSSTIVWPQLSYRKAKIIVLAVAIVFYAISAAGAKPTSLANSLHATTFASTIASFLPVSGAPGTLVTVTGSGFTSASTLTIGGKPAIVISYTATQIVGMVMPGAITGKAVVDGISSATDFTVTATLYPIFQQGAKLIDSAKHSSTYGNQVVAQQGSTVVLSADGNTAIVSGVQNSYNVYLLYTRANGRWNVTKVFGAGMGSPVGQSDVSLSADGNKVLIGKEFGGSGPVMLYERNNKIWTDGRTLNDSVGSTVSLSADGKTAILGRQSRGGNYGGGGYTPRGITIMKFINNTWQAQAVPDVPADSARYAIFQGPQFDENGEYVPQEPQYYNAYTGIPGNLVTISADGKTAASVSFGLYGRYSYVFQIPYTVIYALKPTGWTVETKILQDVRYIKLSADGNTFIAGGAVYLRSAGIWTKQEGVYGTALSADGNTVLAAGEHLIAFTRNGSIWTQREVPAETPPADVDQYSSRTCALSADGSTAFFGAPGDKTVPIYAANGDFYNYAGSVTAFGTTLYNPLDHATTITFSNTTATSTTLSWPRGDGNINRAVFLKMGTDGLPAVMKGTAYTPDSLFMSFNRPIKGSVAATGWYCVYNGKGGYVNITGLKTGTTYTASIVEYTGGAGAETYQLTGVTTRVTTPVVPPNYYTQIRTARGNNPATMRDIEYSPYGPVPAGVTIFVKELGTNPYSFTEIPLPGTASYTANNKFGAGDQIDTSGWFCVYSGAYSMDLLTATGSNLLTVTGLRPGAYYRVVGVNYNGSKTNPVYTEPGYMERSGQTFVTEHLDPPTGYATALAFTNTTATSTTLSWKSGNGGSRAVFIGIKGNVLPVPEDYTTYNAAAAIGSGTQLGTSGWYCVYNASGSSVDISNLLAGTTYRAEVIEYNNGPGNERYMTSRFATLDLTTPKVAPTLQASGITFAGTTGTTTTVSWTNGNGAGRAVFASNSATGAPLPADIYYAGGPKFNNGTQIGNSGWYCVYNGTGSTANLTQLTNGQTYRVAVVEYNGTLAAPKYLTTAIAPANFTTPIEAPSGYATALAFTNTTANSTTLSWTSGSGGSRAVFIGIKGNALPIPADYTTYNAAAAIGSGTQLGTSGWYCVYKGSGSSVNISSLLAGTTYRAEVIEYNGGPGNERYMTSRFATLDLTTPKVAPTVQASGITFAGTTGTTTTVSWTNGNGAGRAVFASNSATGAPLPADIYYAGGPKFNNGTQIGNSGWYCIYNGTGSTANLIQLTNGQTYRVAVVEYNGTLAAPFYSTSGILPANVTTPIEAPTGYATSQVFSNTAATSTTLSWLNNNGEARVVFIKSGANGVLPVTNGTTYLPGAFGAGTAVGTSDWYCVFNGTGNTVNITGLSANTTYRAVVIEYNGTGTTAAYNISRYNVASVITTAAAVVLSANLKRTLVAQDVLADDVNATELNVHQGMSPNADGINDIFIIDGINAYPENTVQIMNSNGDVIYTATGYDNSSKAFDGHAANGTLQKAGTYFYALAYKKGTEVIHETGYLLIKF